MVAFITQIPEKVKHIPEIQELFDAIQVAKNANNPYAQTYINAVEQSIAEYGIEGLKTQLLYIKCNLGSWRGESARQTKKIFDKWNKILSKYV